MFSRHGTRQKFDFFFYKKAGFSVIVKLSPQKIDVVQILVYTIKLEENKALAESFIPRNSKTLNVEKLLKHSSSIPCFRSRNVCCCRKRKAS